MNKAIRRTGTFLLSAVLLLSGCAEAEDTVVTTDKNSPADAAEVRVAYYEKLVGDLQAEILNMKSELSETRADYEEQLEAIKKKRPVSESFFTYTVKDGEATLLSYTGTENAEVVLPVILGGAVLTAIADRAFENHTELTSVVLPEALRSIGWFAFSGCSALGGVTLPVSVETIRYGAFQNCAGTLTFSCAEGSYAEQYARSYGIPVVAGE